MTRIDERYKWPTLGAVSLVFFFLNAATFASLGVVLFTMIAQLHWSQTAAGFSFSLLGIACGVASPLPAILMRHISCRAIIVLGGACLTAGFWLAYRSSGLRLFYLAMILVGVGYALAGNVPGIYLVASWFPARSARMIGIYLMIGASGNVAGPPLVAALVAATHSWRLHWFLMSIAAALIALICLLLVRDAPSAGAPGRQQDARPRAAAGSGAHWSERQAMLTPQFMLLAAAMTLTVAGITTTSSVAVGHLVREGATPAFAAWILSLVALVATVAKGVAGRLCEMFRPSRVFAAGLALQCAGDIALSYGGSPFGAYAFACVFGVGWGWSYLAGCVLPLEYFGREVGSRVLSVVWLVSTAAAAGPLLAGMIADRYGTFSPIFALFAVLLIVLSLALLNMRAPTLRRAPQK
jgi:predicted MFS family arabinose efflux permease